MAGIMDRNLASYFSTPILQSVRDVQGRDKEIQYLTDFGWGTDPIQWEMYREGRYNMGERYNILLISAEEQTLVSERCVGKG